MDLGLCGGFYCHYKPLYNDSFFFDQKDPGRFYDKEHVFVV